MPSLPCDAIVYRLARRPDWINPDNRTLFAPIAFLRRFKPKEPGLSALVQGAISLEDAKDYLPGGCHGVCTLHVGHIRDIKIPGADGASLNVEITNSPHACITGMPIGVHTHEHRVSDTDLALARYLAGELAKQSRVIDDPLAPSPSSS